MVKGKYLLFLKLNSGALQDAKVHEQVLHPQEMDHGLYITCSRDMYVHIMNMYMCINVHISIYMLPRTPCLRKLGHCSFNLIHS